MKTFNVFPMLEVKQYVLTYPKKEGKIVNIIHIDNCGDCLVRFKNGKRDKYHISWLKEITE